METLRIDAIVKHRDLVWTHWVISENILFDLFGYCDNRFNPAWGKLFLLERQETLMIDTQSLPNSPAGSPRLPQAMKKTAVRSAAATEHVLFDHSPKAHGYVAAGLRN